MAEGSFSQRLADNTTALAASLDGVAARGAARTWFAAAIRVYAVWVGVPTLYTLVSTMPSDIEEVIGSYDYAANGGSISMFTVFLRATAKLAPHFYFVAIALAAWKADRIAAWVFPLLRRCPRCGYTIGRVSKTTAATPCPECGEGKDAKG